MSLTLTPAGTRHAAEIFKSFFEDHRGCRYHHDFLCFRKIFLANQARWLEGDENATREIARCLQCVLIHWGANKRNAPFAGLDQFVARLREKHFRCAMERLFASRSVAAVDEDNRARVLKQLYRLFVPRPKRSTYPTKALMLLCPHVPAFDSNVREALHCIPAHLRKWDGTAAELLALHKILEAFWARHGQHLLGVLQQVNHEHPAEEWDACPGRVVDMFLFSVGKRYIEAEEPRLLEWEEP